MIETSLIIGIVASTLGISGFLYQMVYKPNGLTYQTMGFIGLGTSTWAAYGISISDPIISIVNITLVVLLGFSALRKRMV
jgi:hypothetical protein